MSPIHTHTEKDKQNNICIGKKEKQNKTIAITEKTIGCQNCYFSFFLGLFFFFFFLGEELYNPQQQQQKVKIDVEQRI